MNFYDKESLKIASHPKMQELFRERMGVSECGLCFCGLDEKAHAFIDDHSYSGSQTPDFILPLPIDPGSPERGLAGMVSGTWMLQKWGDDDYELTIREDGDILYYIGKTSTLVLLKALAYQIGAEVKR